MEADPANETFTYNLWHWSAINWKYLDAGLVYHQPMLFRDCGSYDSRGFAPVNVDITTSSPDDNHGNFSFGLTNGCTQEMLDVAEKIIVEVNPNMPVVFGMGSDHIHVSKVDAIVESEEPISLAPNREPSAIDQQIAENIFPYLHDGITLQLGIGGMPNALGSLIAGLDLKDVGMHTELMSRRLSNWYESGKITNDKKPFQRGKGVFSICMGSKELYEILDHNQDILSAPMHYVDNQKESASSMISFPSTAVLPSTSMARSAGIGRDTENQRDWRPSGLRDRRLCSRSWQSLPGHAVEPGR